MSARREGGGSAPLAFVLASGIILGALWVGAGRPSIEQVIGSSSVDASVVNEPTWQCYWEPTINDDWHDGVLCMRGLESDRPILLADQEFVTEAETMAAAVEHQATLNG